MTWLQYKIMIYLRIKVTQQCMQVCTIHWLHGINVSIYTLVCTFLIIIKFRADFGWLSFNSHSSSQSFKICAILTTLLEVFTNINIV